MIGFLRNQCALLFVLMSFSQLSASTVFQSSDVVTSTKKFFQDIGKDVVQPLLTIFNHYGENNVMAVIGKNGIKITTNGSTAMNSGLGGEQKILFVFINTFINDEANIAAETFVKEMNLQNPNTDKNFGISIELQSRSSVKKVTFITPFECLKLFDCGVNNNNIGSGSKYINQGSWHTKSLIAYLDEFDRINQNVKASSNINSLFKLYCEQLSGLVNNIRNNKKLASSTQLKLHFETLNHYKESCVSDSSYFKPKFGIFQEQEQFVFRYREYHPNHVEVTLPYQLFHTEIMYQVLVRSKKICPTGNCILSGKLSCWSCDGFMKVWKDMETDTERKYFVACSSVGLERSTLPYYTQKIKILSSYGKDLILSNKDETDYWLHAARFCYENEGDSTQYEQIMLFDNYHRFYPSAYDIHKVFCEDVLNRAYCLDLSSINKDITCDYIERYYHHYFPMLAVINPNIKYLYGELGKKHFDFLNGETSKIEKDSEIAYHNSICKFISKYAPHCLVEGRYCKDNKNTLINLLFSEDIEVFSVGRKKSP